MAKSEFSAFLKKHYVYREKVFSQRIALMIRERVFQVDYEIGELLRVIETARIMIL
jgi:hypothetical protein